MMNKKDIKDARNALVVADYQYLIDEGYEPLMARRMLSQTYRLCEYSIYLIIQKSKDNGKQSN